MGVRAKGTLKSIPINPERVKSDTQKSREAIIDAHKSEIGSKKVPLKLRIPDIRKLSFFSFPPRPPSTGLHCVEIQIKLISDMVLLYFQWTRHKGIVKKDMFSELPLTFQAELSLILNKHVLEKVYSSLHNTYTPGSYDLNIYD